VRSDGRLGDYATPPAGCDSWGATRPTSSATPPAAMPGASPHGTASSSAAPPPPPRPATGPAGVAVPRPRPSPSRRPGIRRRP
jgi:hypothetical protein